jgi:DNA mismatch repair protein MutL
MPIQILPAQLANQIAAGEVVERPASVIKELIENSLDAGATRIDIEVDKGGAKRLLIRDNGCGVPKEELTLALSRHATSKVATQEDLEQILTLGFRGEALASISSVSRLTFTSKTATQDSAWQAQAYGRDMEVEVRPAAHPVGTSVEVVDLFFNTPARRKFMRTEKTEFYHIDELLKRLALSRFDVAISLKHNDKSVRNYRAANSDEQRDRRVAAVLGSSFLEHCVRIDNQHDSMRFSGWLGLGGAARVSLDGQYFYVNGRMMRDKLINHAIRQSLAGLVDEPLHPSYVLFLELPADQVDVNVHPSKHEVRFHQSRLVHDYIVRVLSQVLLHHQELPAADDDGVWLGDTAIQPLEHCYLAHDAVHQRSQDRGSAVGEPRLDRSSPPEYQPQPLRKARGDRGSQQRPFERSAPLRQEIQVSQAWFSALGEPQADDQAAKLGDGRRPLHFVSPGYLLFSDAQALKLLCLKTVWTRLQESDFIEQWPQGLKRVPLLLPQQLSMPVSEGQFIEGRLELFRRLGFELARQSDTQWALKEVPVSLRRSDFASLLPALVTKLEMLPCDSLENPQLVCACLVDVSVRLQQFNWQTALSLFNRLEQRPAVVLTSQMVATVPSQRLIELFNHD